MVRSLAELYADPFVCAGVELLASGCQEWPFGVFEAPPQQLQYQCGRGSALLGPNCPAFFHINKERSQEPAVYEASARERSRSEQVSVQPETSR